MKMKKKPMKKLMTKKTKIGQKCIKLDWTTILEITTKYMDTNHECIKNAIWFSKIGTEKGIKYPIILKIGF